MKWTALLMPLLLACVATAGDDTLEEKFERLKDAVSGKNAVEVKKVADEVFPLVTQAICESAPEDEEERPAWKSRIEHAKGIGSYAEYALYAAAMEASPATMADLIADLEQQNPKSKYLDAAYGPYLVALAKSGAGAKTVPVAEKALANFPENEDLLLLLADSALLRKQTDRALTYANRLIAALVRHPKPEGAPAAQWDRKRDAMLGRGYWISGVIYAERAQYTNADKNLRAALPLVRGNDAMTAPALFHLGTANYYLGRTTLSKALVLEAAKFSDQCAAMDSPYADHARHNALVMRNDAARMR